MSGVEVPGSSSGSDAGPKKTRARRKPVPEGEPEIPVGEVAKASLPDSMCSIPLSEFNEALSADWTDRARGGEKRKVKTRKFGTGAVSVGVSPAQRSALVRTAMYLLSKMYTRANVVHACSLYLSLSIEFIEGVVDLAHERIAEESGVSVEQVRYVVHSQYGDILRGKDTTVQERLKALSGIQELYGIKGRNTGGSGSADVSYLDRVLAGADSAKTVEEVERMIQAVRDEMTKLMEKQVRGRS